MGILITACLKRVKKEEGLKGCRVCRSPGSAFGQTGGGRGDGEERAGYLPLKHSSLAYAATAIYKL